MVKDILFPLGRVYMTRGAMEVLDEMDIRTALVRHSCGDWGDLDEEDKKRKQLQFKARLQGAVRVQIQEWQEVLGYNRGRQVRDNGAVAGRILII